MTSISPLGHAVVARRGNPGAPQCCSEPITPRTTEHIASLLALQRVSGLYRNPVFLLCLASGPLFWIVLSVAYPLQPLAWEQLWALPFLAVTIWEPIVEELFFRGLVQGQLRRGEWGRQSFTGISTANLLTSVLFALAHLAGHAFAWSLLVFIPSLLFGLVRDRFESVYPAIVLHIFFNVGYFFLTSGPILQHG